VSQPSSSAGVAIALSLQRLAATAWPSLIDRLLIERDRWPLWFPVLFGAGVAAHLASPVEPSPLLCAGLAAAAALASLVARGMPRVVAVIAALILAGVFVTALKTAAIGAPVLDRRIGPIDVTGRVMAVDGAGGARQRILLAGVAVDRLAASRTPAQVRIRLAAGDRLPDVGGMVRVRAILFPPPEPAEPGAFDFRLQAYFDRLGATGYALAPVRRVAGPEPGTWDRVRISLERLRGHIAERVDAAVSDRAAAKVTGALMHGEQTDIDPEVMAWFRASGLAHLLSISGLHISLVAGTVFFFVRAALAAIPPLALRLPLKKIGAVAGLLAATGYALVVGAPVPTVRSLLMTALVLLAVLADRVAISLRTIAFAAMAVLVLFPESLAGVSFQMSFAAVVALVAAYEALEKPLARLRAADRPGRRLVLYLFGLVLSSAVATVATAPFSLYHFQQIAPFGIVANMIAVPVTAFIVMPMAIIVALTMPFGLDHWPIVAMGWGVGIIVETARIVASLPHSLLRVPAMPPVTLGAMVIGGLWLCLWRTGWRWLGLAPFAFGLVLGPSMADRPDVLVNDDGRIVGLREATGRRLFSTDRANNFAIQSWRRRDGEDPDAAAPALASSGRSADGSIVCTAAACTMTRAGIVVSYVRTRAGLQRSCRTAQIVITSLDAGSCGAATVIDRNALIRDGPHAVHIRDGHWTVSTVRGESGRRRWTGFNSGG
jgi:competence protein ComEC